MKKHILLSLVVLMFFNTCKKSGPVEPPEPPQPLPDDVALYVSFDDWEGVGIRVLNANSLDLVDSLITKPGVPRTIEFSPDNNTLYSCWGRGANYSLYSVDVHPLAIRNSVPLLYSKYALAKSADERYLVAYGSNGIDIFDRQTLSLVLQDTSDFYGGSSHVAMYKNHNRFIFTKWQNRRFCGFGVYDLDSFKVIDSILFDIKKYPNIQDADLIVSVDDRFLFFTAWNWRGGGGFGSFFVIDLVGRRIAAEFPCGPFARLAVSPDGKSVYISKAGFTLYLFPPNDHRTYRYDVKTNTLVNFLSRGGATGIAIADDNRTIFISDSKEIHKVDALSGTIFGSYTIPTDSLGNFSSTIRNIRLGKYLRQ